MGFVFLLGAAAVIAVVTLVPFLNYYYYNNSSSNSNNNNNNNKNNNKLARPSADTSTSRGIGGHLEEEPPFSFSSSTFCRSKELKSISRVGDAGGLGCDVPDDSGIYFIPELDPDKPAVNARRLCAVETAARENPERPLVRGGERLITTILRKCCIFFLCCTYCRSTWFLLAAQHQQKILQV